MGCTHSTETSTPINKYPKSKQMQERKNRLIETALILGIQLDEFKDSDMFSLLDMLKDGDEQNINKSSYNSPVVVANYALAPFDQMFPYRFPVILRSLQYKPQCMKEAYGCYSFTREKKLIGEGVNQNMILKDNKYQISHLEAVKYFTPNSIYTNLSSRNITDMHFQTNSFITLNGLNFYPTDFISEERNYEVVRFKSDGITILTKNEVLICQLREKLIENEMISDKLQEDKNEHANEQIQILFTEWRKLNKQLELELERLARRQIFLTIDIPVGWHCIANCYWINLSIIRS